MDPAQLPAYDYCPLEDARRDIRIVEVLPGQFDDNLRVQIHHAPLLEPPDVADTRMTIPQLKATLPKGWDVCRNPEGKYLFYRNDNNAPSTWEHPDPSVDKATYELPTYHNKSDPHYEALSYVWGSSETPHHLIVEGGQGCPRLPITDSLMTALRHLRQPNKSRRLWVDAICINQSDSDEIESQVQRMGLIYKLAYRVVVWLGPQSDDSAHALATLDHLGAQIEVDEDDGGILTRPSAEEPRWRFPRTILPYSQETWEAILALLLRPWFRRVWTLQEIQLGSKRPGPIFQCGIETINYSGLYRAVRCLQLKHVLSEEVDLPRLERELVNAKVLLYSMVGSFFWEILRHGMVGRGCQDRRDKIYGTIGLLPKRFASKIKVNYGKNNTAGQVYKETFLTHAQHVERLELFADCFVTGRLIHDIPSWVPDWYAENTWEQYHGRQFATGTSRAHFKYTDEEPDLLEVLGVACAVVSHVSQYLSQELDDEAAADHVKQWEPRDLDTAIYRPTGEPLRKAYACTLIEDCIDERQPTYEYISLEKWIEQAGDHFLFGNGEASPGELDDDDSGEQDDDDSGESDDDDSEDSDDDDSEDSDDDSSMDMAEAVGNALDICCERCFIQTHEGYIGLAPPETMPGDVVAIFLGCSNPFILRPEEGRYSMVGECFVYGLGDATKLLGPLPEPWRVISKPVSGRESLHYFFDPRTEEETREDPRLEPLHNWSRVDRVPDGDDPIHFDFFENQETGVVVNYDPRLEPELLEKRGVQLEKFILV